MLVRGLLAGAMSGKLGAMVASHNKGGQYFRARVVPSGAVATLQQAAVRNAVGSLSAAWSSELTQDQRDAWGVYAVNVPGRNALGDAIQLSGQNWFIACNTPRLQAELDRVDDAPTVFDRGTPSILPVVSALNAGGGTITLGSTLTLDGNVLVYGSKPFSAGRSKYYGSKRLVNTYDATTGVIHLPFTPPFAYTDSNNQMTFDIVITRDDGRLSTPLGVTFRP